MLHEWQKNVGKYVPETLPGYDYVCRIPVFIPVREIGLTVWERRVQSLSFIHECILTAVGVGTRSIPELARQFGLPESIMLQIVAQLDTEQLATVSAGSIILTGKGRQVLESQQKIQILRKQLSRIFVNQITGEITDAAPVGVCREPPRGQVYLREVHPVSLSFLRSRFETLSIIYRESRLEHTVFQAGTTEEAELYRILDIFYQTLSYVREFCFVYINQEDKSLAFRFCSGIQPYADALLEQINAHENGARYLLSQPMKPAGPAGGETGLPARLVEAFSPAGHHDQRLAAMEEAYYESRPLLDGEVEDILYHCHTFRAERILIEAPHLGDFLTGTTIPALLSQHTKQFILRYSEGDRSAKRVLDAVREEAKRRKECKVSFIPVKSISEVKLYFGNACAITARYYPKETVYRRCLYKLCAQITFDQAEMQNLWDRAGTL